MNYKVRFKSYISIYKNLLLLIKMRNVQSCSASEINVYARKVSREVRTDPVVNTQDILLAG